MVVRPGAIEGMDLPRNPESSVALFLLDTWRLGQGWLLHFLFSYSRKLLL